MRIGIIVEGDDDKDVLETIFKKEEWREKISREKIRVRPVGGGKIKNQGYVKSAAQLLREHGCEKMILLYDTDTPNKEEAEKEIKKHDGAVINEFNITTAKAHISIESWILGCFEDIGNPENFRDAKTAKREIKKKMYGGSKGRTISMIAEGNQIRHFEKSSSFKEFESTIEKLAKS